MKQCGIVLAFLLLMFSTGCGQSPQSSNPTTGQQVTRTPSAKPATASAPSGTPDQKVPTKPDCKDSDDCSGGPGATPPILVAVVGQEGHEDVTLDAGRSWQVQVSAGVHLIVFRADLPPNCVLVNNMTRSTVQATVSGAVYTAPQTQPVLANSVARFCP